LPPGAHRLLSLAQEEARLLGHPRLSTEHLLLGLLREPEGRAGRLLTQGGLTLPQARQAVSALAGHGATYRAGAIGLTPRVKQVLALAWAEAVRRQRAEIAPEHVLFGLLTEGGGLAAGLLTRLNIAPAPLRQQLAAALAEG